MRGQDKTPRQRAGGKQGLFELTPEREKQLVAFVRAGGHPHVAAEAVGIPKEVFDQWMQLGKPTGRGKNTKPHPKYTKLWQAVMVARGQAQLRAEIKALDDEPLQWLKFGPGKETQERPGWSGLPRPVVREDNTTVNVLLSPEMQGVFGAILQVLTPYPEARAAVAAALAGKPAPKIIEQIRE